MINSGNANAETGEKGFADALAMSERAADALGLETEQVAVAETGVIGVPMPMSAVLPGIEQAAKHLSTDGGAVFADAIMTTDRWPKRVTLEVDGVTLSAQAKGAGMIQPNMATMLCFVQTDAVVDDPGGGAAARGRCLLQPDHRRRPDEHQRHRPPAGDRRLRQAAPRGPARRGAPAAGDRDRPRRRGRRTGRAGSGRAAPPTGPRPSGSRGRSPTRTLVKTALYGRDPNWGRIAQAAGAALAGAEMDEIGAERIDAAELGGDAPRPRSASDSAGATPGRTSISPTSVTST